MANEAPAPNRRPRFPLGAAQSLEYLVCAPPAVSAAVGEARRLGVSSVCNHHRYQTRSESVTKFREMFSFAFGGGA
jgi:hypothetical protein